MIQIEAAFMFLGVFIGIFLHMIYKSVNKGKKKRTGTNSRMDNQLVDNTLPEEDEWVDESDSDDSDYLRNQGPEVIEESQLFAKYPISDIKMVLVVNDSLKMGKGKIGAQCGHATLAAYQSARRMSSNSKYWTKVLEKWSWEGTKKICVKVKSDEEIMQVQ